MADEFLCSKVHRTHCALRFSEAPPVKSPEVFYLHINGEQRGPYTIQHIDHLLNSGLIQETAMFWREGLEQWQPVTNLVAVRTKKRSRIRPAMVVGVLVVA